MRIILILALLLSGCGSRPPKHNGFLMPVGIGIDAEFIKYVAMFEDDYRKYLNKDIEVTIPIKFGKIPKQGFSAICWRPNGPNSTLMSPYILVDKNIWLRLPDFDRKYLIYHELGHCILNREHIHVEDFHSIMNHTLPVHSLVEDEEELVEELFLRNLRTSDQIQHCCYEYHR